eukprot:scaffold37279_cov69-Phaeocystis_antarctica.AAC.5
MVRGPHLEARRDRSCRVVSSHFLMSNTARQVACSRRLSKTTHPKAVRRRTVPPQAFARRRTAPQRL